MTKGVSSGDHKGISVILGLLSWPWPLVKVNLYRGQSILGFWADRNKGNIQNTHFWHFLGSQRLILTHRIAAHLFHDWIIVIRNTIYAFLTDDANIICFCEMSWLQATMLPNKFSCSNEPSLTFLHCVLHSSEMEINDSNLNCRWLYSVFQFQFILYYWLDLA